MLVFQYHTVTAISEQLEFPLYRKIRFKGNYFIIKCIFERILYMRYRKLLALVFKHSREVISILKSTTLHTVTTHVYNTTQMQCNTKLLSQSCGRWTRQSSHSNDEIASPPSPRVHEKSFPEPFAHDLSGSFIATRGHSNNPRAVYETKNREKPERTRIDSPWNIWFIIGSRGSSNF